MRLSSSTKYALLAVGYVARSKGKKLVLSHNVAKEYDIPLEYLLKIMQGLVKVRILRSKRGPRGGFSLARPLSKITMLDVIEAVEGSMDVSLGLQENAPRDRFAVKAERAYDKVIAGTRTAFKNVKLSSLV
ncbi:MAG: RrF2 family transcriptional regulator [Planctomycetota bacterium]|jgi:Rrf2 family protein